MKEIFRIILVRQVILPVIFLFLFMLILPKATVILIAKTTIDPILLAKFFVYSVFLVAIALWYAWYPYTCISIWNSAKKLSPGWLPTTAKFYAAVFLAMIIGPGIYAIPKLPEIYSKLEAHQAAQHGHRR